MGSLARRRRRSEPRASVAAVPARRRHGPGGRVAMLRCWGGSGEPVVEQGMLGGPEKEARRWRQWQRRALFHVGLSTTTYCWPRMSCDRRWYGGGSVSKRRLGGARHVQGAGVDALAHGAWPWPCAVHDVGAAHRRKRQGGGPRRIRSTAEMPKRPYTG
jgi:hypothetical protein